MNAKSKLASTTQNIWNFIVVKVESLKKWQTLAIILEISDSNHKKGDTAKNLGLLDYPGRVDSPVIIISSRKWFRAYELPLISPCTSPLLFRNSSPLSTSLTREKHVSSGIMGQAPALKDDCLWTSSNIVPPEKGDYLSFIIIIMMRMIIMIATTIPM